MAKTYEISAISTVSKGQSTVDPAYLKIPGTVWESNIFHLFTDPLLTELS